MPSGEARRSAEDHEMTKFGDDLIRSLKEAVAHAKGESPKMVHQPLR